MKFENFGFFSGKKTKSGNKRWHPLKTFFQSLKNFYVSNYHVVGIQKVAQDQLFTTVKKYDHTTCQSENMAGNVKKLRKKNDLSPFEAVANFAESLHFFRKTFFKGPLEKFLRIQQPCCMYLEGRPSVALYNGNKIMIVRPTNQKI